MQTASLTQRQLPYLTAAELNELRTTPYLTAEEMREQRATPYVTREELENRGAPANGFKTQRLVP
jgi:hypothetical protein